MPATAVPLPRAASDAGSNNIVPHHHQDRVRRDRDVCAHRHLETPKSADACDHELDGLLGIHKTKMSPTSEKDDPKVNLTKWGLMRMSSICGDDDVVEFQAHQPHFKITKFGGLIWESSRIHHHGKMMLNLVLWLQCR